VTGNVEETPLPGVGVRYGFETTDGPAGVGGPPPLGAHQVFVGEPGDPDASEQVLELDDDDSRVLSELLGASRVVREIDRLQQSVAGLTLEWITIAPSSVAAGRTIGELEIRSSTGVTVIAAMRGGEALPVPGPDFELRSRGTPWSSSVAPPTSPA
jgi:TrkA domain protein